MTEHPFLVAGQNAIVSWASTATGVSAVLLTGLRGRPDDSADAYSDLDLLILVTRPPADYVEAIAGIETAVLVSRQPYGSDEYDLAIVGADFARLDVTLLRTASTATSVREAVAPVVAAKHLWRGYRVLVDRMPQADHSLPPRPAFDPPDGAALTALAGQFWVQALRAAVFIVRQDLWRAETLLVCRLRPIWLRLAEWDARLAEEGATDIWYDGRHIETWAQGPARDALGQLFAAYDQRALAEALWAMGTSFAQLLERVAQRRHLDTASDGGVRQHLETLLGRLSESGDQR